MKNYLIGAVLLIVGCGSGSAKPPEKPEQPTPPPVVIEEPIEPKDCSRFEQITNNPSINEWLKIELDKCRGLTN